MRRILGSSRPLSGTGIARATRKNKSQNSPTFALLLFFCAGWCPGCGCVQVAVEL